MTAAQIHGVRALHTVAGCREQRALLLEGEHLVREALVMGRLLRVFAAPAMNALGEACAAAGVAVDFVDDKTLARLVQTRSPQGVCGIVDWRQVVPEDLVADRLLVLDGLQDPGNVGTLLRSAEAAGFGGCLMCGGVSLCNTKLIRASMGSVLRVPVAQMPGELAGAFLAAQGYQVRVLALEGQSLFAIKAFPRRLALVVGSEGAGVSAAFDGLPRLRIPMAGAVESLNAGVAGSLAMLTVAAGEVE